MSLTSHVPKIIGIVACSDPRGVIGVNGDIPWTIKRDKQFFRDLTSGHVVIMGRKTYDSAGYLPRRCNIVLSSRPKFLPIESENLRIAHDMPEALLLGYQWAEKYCSDVFIIGGAQIYELFLPNIDVFYVTEVEDTNEQIVSDDEMIAAIPQIVEKLQNEAQWRSLRLFGGADKQYNYGIVRYNKIRG